MRKITDKERNTKDRHTGIVNLYVTGDYTTERIAQIYGLTVRSVQRIAKKYGVIRTIAASNKLMARHKQYHHVPAHLRVQRKHLTRRQRALVLGSNPYCNMCGRRPGEGARLEVDHIDENPLNNDMSNLQVLCQFCNIGKSQIHRFGNKPEVKEMTRLEKITALKQTAPRK